MTNTTGFSITTPRLLIRPAAVEDAELFLRLWTDRRVMVHAGFPRGLSTSLEEIRTRIAQSGPSEYERLLVVEIRDSGQVIGECHLHTPNAEGVAATDVKLLPEHWGGHYGVEIKRALLDYLFTHTDCLAVDGTPNVANTASIRMQETVGGKRIGEHIHTFPPSMQEYTVPVHYYVYRVTRADWLERQRGTPDPGHSPTWQKEAWNS